MHAKNWPVKLRYKNWPVKLRRNISLCGWKGAQFNTGPYMHFKCWPVTLQYKNWSVKLRRNIYIEIYTIFHRKKKVKTSITFFVCLGLKRLIFIRNVCKFFWGKMFFFIRATLMSLGLLVALENADKVYPGIKISKIGLRSDLSRAKISWSWDFWWLRKTDNRQTDKIHVL